MTRLIGTLTITVAVLALFCQGADAGGRRHKIDHRIKVVSLGVGAASTVGYLALNDWHWGYRGRASTGFTATSAYVAATAGCVAISPMVATAVVRRPLTYREAHVLMVGCVVPIIGPMLVNAAYDAHPEWSRFDDPPPRRRRR